MTRNAAYLILAWLILGSAWAEEPCIPEDSTAQEPGTLADQVSRVVPAIETRAIITGPYSGKRLREVVESYRGPGKVRIPARAIQDAFRFFDQHSALFKNQKYLVIFDLNQMMRVPRLHIVDLETGETESAIASHGKGSDPQHTGRASAFDANTGDQTCGPSGVGHGNHQCTASPRGFFRTGRFEPSQKHPYRIELEGLEKASGDFPGNDRLQDIVMHDADYVDVGGRSNGCPAVDAKVLRRWKDRLPGGALFYFYHSSLDSADGAPREPQLSPLKPR